MKKVFTYSLILVLAFSLCACGRGKTNTETTTAADESIDAAPTTETATEAEPTQNSASVTKASFGSPISTSFVEINFSEYNYVADARQSIKQGNVTRTFGPAPVEGKQFLLLRGTIKNTNTEELPVYDFFIGEFNLDGYKYEIDANDCEVYDSNGQTTSTIEPLSTYEFIMYSEIPDELANNTPHGTFTFGFYELFDNLELSYNRSEENPISLCPYQYLLNLD